MFGAISRFLDIFAYLRSPFLLVIRLLWGYLFFAAGYDKLINWDARLDMFMGLGIPMPYYSLLLVTCVEYLGGLMLMIGLFSRFWAFALSVTMIVAYATAHAAALTPLSDSLQALTNAGVFMLDSSMMSFAILKPAAAIIYKPFIDQSPFSFLYMTLLVLMWGPGYLSIDGILGMIFCRRKSSEVVEVESED